MKSLEEVKYLFVSRGPGETSQALSLAKYFAGQKRRVIFAVHQRINFSFLGPEKEKFKTFLTPTPIEFTQVLQKEKPDVLLLFNSKMWGSYRGFFESYPEPKPLLTIALDSNWLFNGKKYPHYPFIRWADYYFLLFPERIFKLGLKKNGGNFEIEKGIENKIIPVGFIPSFKKPEQKALGKIRETYRIRENDKFIFSYFSGFGAGHRIWALENFIKAMEELIKKRKNIKALYVGPVANFNSRKLKKPWLIIRKKLSNQDFFFTLASSDLIFQHQGLATLSQAVSCRIPVIANVSNILKQEAIHKLHFWEVEPFERAGVCKLLSKNTPAKKIAEAIEGLLFDENAVNRMKNNQSLVFKAGEEKAFTFIEDLVKKRL